VVLGLLACAVPAHAGLYSSAEPPGRMLSPDYRQFRETLINLWDITGLANADYKSEKLLSKRYLLLLVKQAQQQLERGVPRNLTVGERIDLGAALIRLGRYNEAVQVLKPRERQDQGDFLLLSNLATAYYLAGQEAQAVDAVLSALAVDVWPREWAKVGKDRQALLAAQFGWDAAQFASYRKAETYFKKLLLLRRRSQSADKLDDLFGVRFVGDSGKYEPGTLAAAERKKLPKDAVLIVEQLLVWLPTDPQLYWQLAELYNAQGDTRSAAEIFETLVSRGSRSPELREHRRILQAQRTAPVAATNSGSGITAPANPDQGSPAGDAPSWGPGTWQALGVGFLAGALVMLFGSWQVREIVRRRQH
jgi:tetratricopeptide (TPR) repeat protein